MGINGKRPCLQYAWRKTYHLLQNMQRLSIISVQRRKMSLDRTLKNMKIWPRNLLNTDSIVVDGEAFFLIRLYICSLTMYEKRLTYPIFDSNKNRKLRCL